MYINSKDRSGVLRKIKISIGDFLGQEKDSEYIEMREPDIGEVMELNSDYNDDSQAWLINNMPNLITRHTLHETETDMMTNEAVAGLIKERVDIFIYVAMEYTNFFGTLSRKIKKEI